MKKQNLICALIVMLSLCTTSLHAQFQWFGNMIGPNPSSHCGSLSIRVGFSNNQNCAFLLPNITLQFKASISGSWGSIAVMTPSSPGATGDYYDFSPGATQSGYYRALISTASGYTPCSGQTVASGTSNTVQHIVNPVPVADFNINGGTGIVQTYQCAPVNLNYTGSAFVTQYRYKIEECTAAGIVVVGGYSSNPTYPWVGGTLPATTDLNVGAVATRFDGFPGYYLVTLQVGSATCTSVEKKVRIYVNATAPAATAAFKINNITPPGCSAPMELFGCPAYPITLSNQSTNAVQYMIDLQYSTSSCGAYTTVYNSGYISTFPTDLKNLPGLNGTIVQTQPGFYKVSLTTKNICGATSFSQKGYINVAGPPTGISADFTTKVKVKPSSSYTLNGCLMLANTEFTYKDNTSSCGGPGGFVFPMERTNVANANPAGRTSTEFQIEGLQGTGSNAYTVAITTYLYNSGSWINMNYLGQPEIFPNATSLRLTDLLWDNPANPYYMHFDSDLTAPASNIYKVNIQISNECDTRSNTQIIQLFASLRKGGHEGSIKELVSEEPSVFPNPATDEVTFNVPAVAEDMVSISVYDIKGSRVLDVVKNALTIDGGNVYKANLGSLQTGMYFYKIKTNNTTYNGKLMKQ